MMLEAIYQLLGVGDGKALKQIPALSRIHQEQALQWMHSQVDQSTRRENPADPSALILEYRSGKTTRYELRTQLQQTRFRDGTWESKGVGLDVISYKHPVVIYSTTTCPYWLYLNDDLATDGQSTLLLKDIDLTNEELHQLLMSKDNPDQFLEAQLRLGLKLAAHIPDCRYGQRGKTSYPNLCLPRGYRLIYP